MLRIEGLSKHFGARVLIDKATFHFPERTRVALVGANGAGKTTLLNILCGIEESDGGRIIRPQDMSLGYLPQEPEARPAATVLLEAERGAHRLSTLKEAMAKEEEAMATGNEAAMHRYEHAEAAFRIGGGYGLEARAEQILSGLGFRPEMIAAPPLTLSGGWRMRLELAKVFINDPDFLILDEPTNHLDLPSLVWVEDYLRRFRGSLLFVSHDRALLNRLSQITLHLSHGGLTPYPGGFDDFLEQREAKQQQDQAARDQIERRRADLEHFVTRFGAKATKARQAQSRIKMIQRLTELESGITPAADEATIHFSLPKPPPSGRDVLVTKNLAIGYQKPLASSINLNVSRGQRIAIIGMNGIGKSTLLKTVADRVPALNGTATLGHNVRLAYFAQDQIDVMKGTATVLENMMDASANVGERAARSLLGSFLFRGDDVYKRFNVLSGGEKSRLALARLLVADANFLLLDEPTNHLDMASVEMLGASLSEFTGSVLFVSHDRNFINALASHIFVMLPDGRHALFEGQLEDYQRLAAQTGFPDVLAVSGGESAKGQSPSTSAPSNARVTQKDREATKEKGRITKKLSQLETEQSRIAGDIQKIEEAMGEASGADFAAINLQIARLGELRQALTHAEEEWIELSARLESL